MVDFAWLDAAIAAFSAVVSFRVSKVVMRKLDARKPKLTAEQLLDQHLAKQREKDPVFAVQNPETDELRAIYRKLDEELMLDESVRTPPAPVEVRFAKDQARVNEAQPGRKDPWAQHIQNMLRGSRAVLLSPRSRKETGQPHPANLMLGQGGLPPARYITVDEWRALSVREQVAIIRGAQGTKIYRDNHGVREELDTERGGTWRPSGGLH